MPDMKKDHRGAIVRALRFAEAPQDAVDIVLASFSQAVGEARQQGYEECAEKVLRMASSLAGAGNA